MANERPATYDLENGVDKERYGVILDCAFVALFHESDHRRNAAAKTLVDIFGKENIEVTQIYSGDNQVFLRATHCEKELVFYLCEKPKNYHGKQIVPRIVDLRKV